MKRRNIDNDIAAEEAESLFDEFRRLAQERTRKKINRVTMTRDEFGRHTFWPDAETNRQADGVQIVLPSNNVDVFEKLMHGIRNAETIQLQVDRMRHVAMWLVEEAERIEVKNSFLFTQRDDIH